jgi:hypothetical protein
MDVSFVVVPHPMGMLPLAEIRKKAEDERAEMQGKIEETRAAVQKRTEGDKNRTVKKDQAANGKNGSPGKPQTQKEGLP